MRHAIIALAILATACKGDEVPEQRADGAAQTQEAAPGASVAEIRAARPAAPPEPPANPYVVTAGPSLRIRTATVVDTATGCQYTVRTLYQDDLDITPRNESAGPQSRQMCGQPTGGDAPFVTLPGGDSIRAVRLAIVTDHQTGCQEIVGTFYQDAVSSTPRMEGAGAMPRQVCRG